MEGIAAVAMSAVAEFSCSDYFSECVINQLNFFVLQIVCAAFSEDDSSYLTFLEKQVCLFVQIFMHFFLFDCNVNKYLRLGLLI
jgi:hypothetical protein